MDHWMPELYRSTLIKTTHFLSTNRIFSHIFSLSKYLISLYVHAYMPVECVSLPIMPTWAVLMACLFGQVCWCSSNNQFI
uniref:Uncharacterized protein n=1 Tax=Arundo donax TaxID=35708 RepID=A0A0A9BA62_ARUDO